MLGSKTLLRGWPKHKFFGELQLRLSSKNDNDKDPHNICDKLAGKKPLTPKERKAIIDLDECPTRKYVSPCKDLYKPCIPERLSPHPCTPRSSNIPRPDVECIFDPDCPYSRKSEFGLRLKQLIAAIGSSLLAYLFYKNFFFKQSEVVVDKKTEENHCPFATASDPIRVPEDAYEMPEEIPYLIIGGGTASHAAFKAIQEADSNAKILIVSKESFLPYMRPPLSKALFDAENKDTVENLEFKDSTGTVKSIYFEKPEVFIPCKNLEGAEKGVAVAYGWDITELDVVKREAVVGGRKIKYKKCLIATGAKPKRLDVVEEAEDDIKCRFSYLRGIEDFNLLNSVLPEAKSIAIIGGGFIGSELACSLKKRNKHLKVKIITHSDGVMTSVLPQYLSNWTAEQIAKEEIEVITKSLVEDASLSDKGKLVLHVGDREIEVDHAVVAIGVEPVTDLAEKACLEIDKKNNGYLVNAEMQARDNLFVAGDCASFYDPKLGRRRVEHHQHAQITGKLAGENMAKNNGVYFNTQSMYWSGIGSLSLESIGITDSSLPTVGIFPKQDNKDEKSKDDKTKEQKPKEQKSKDEKSGDGQEEPLMDDDAHERIEGNDFNRGVIFYLKKNIVVGVILWNLADKIEIAKQVLDKVQTYDDLNEIATMFAIHEWPGVASKEQKQEKSKGK